jgi:phenylpropionate dioxygenase-like ring-hydroxylating dioxygenase large terminal subunit
MLNEYKHWLFIIDNDFKMNMIFSQWILSMFQDKIKAFIEFLNQKKNLKNKEKTIIQNMNSSCCQCWKIMRKINLKIIETDRMIKCWEQQKKR